MGKPERVDPTNHWVGFKKSQPAPNILQTQYIHYTNLTPTRHPYDNAPTLIPY